MMLRAIVVGLVLIAAMPMADAQSRNHKSPHEIAEASRQLAEKREACRQEAKAQKLSLLERRKYRVACLKRESR
ncbi:MAG TPA: hypothetical protein VHA55_03195 [Pseudorhodoplanes sp.]|jgi:hypothetical protein|nr:hypothetical protein [Pseudorhodoplanes sp.]